MPRVIVLTTYEGDVHILRALKAGAQGYLLKNTLHSELLQTIRAVHAGKRSLSPEVSFQVAQHVSDQTLTPAEIVVLRLIAAGNANKEIADQLGITEDTVKGRVKSILCETGRQRPDARGDHRPEDEESSSCSPQGSASAHTARRPERVTPAAPRGVSRRAATTNNRVEVRVATPLFHIRRRLAGHRFAAHAPGRRLRPPCACQPGSCGATRRCT